MYQDFKWLTSWRQVILKLSTEYAENQYYQWIERILNLSTKEGMVKTGRYKISDIYGSRIEEIEKQIKIAAVNKQWDKLKYLRTEKKKIEQSMKGAQT
jgi:hypothetical protein